MKPEESLPQRWDHGPIHIEPFICRIEDFDMFLYRDGKGVESRDYDHYFVLRKGHSYDAFTNSARDEQIILGYYKKSGGTGEYVPDLGRDDPYAPHGMSSERRIHLLRLGYEALNKYMRGELVKPVYTGDALERL